jgi:hypothetical protein
LDELSQTRMVFITAVFQNLYRTNTEKTEVKSRTPVHNWKQISEGSNII